MRECTIIGMTRREVLSATALTAGALTAEAILGGCRRDWRNERMTYRKLGRTGLEVSIIGFGAEWMERNTQEVCTAVTRRCEEYGINIVDCWMSNPEVRTRLGNALAPHRDRWIIQGHVGATWRNGQYERTRDLPRCREAFEDLLRRLQTDYVDIGMIHYVDSLPEWESVVHGPFLDYMKELKAAGRIRHIGMSTHNPLVGLAAAKSGFVESIMFSVNPAYDILPPIDDLMSYYKGDERYEAGLGGIAPERAELYRTCEALGVGIVVMKAYAGGRLFDAKTSPFKVALTPVQCLHYALTRPGVVTVLPGYGKPEHVDDAFRYLEATPKERDYASVLAKAPRHAYSGQCTYCGHCAPCSMGIDIAMVNKLYDLAVAQSEVPASVKEHYRALKVHAGKCSACRRCEGRCPFRVGVAARMKAAAKLFGY